MKLYAPRYYHRFACIADKCKHSCCVGWEIDVDEKSLQTYASLSEGYGKEICESIEEGECPHFRLLAGERCPHLNARGLCNIILELGEDYLCDICREHPRFYNDTSYGKEVGIGMACEEACRVILEADDYAELVEVGECEGGCFPFAVDTFRFRSRVYEILSNRSDAYSARLARLYKTFSVSPAVCTDAQWETMLASLEYLDAKHREQLASWCKKIDDRSAFDTYLERALAYFVYRHCAEAYDEKELFASFGLCLFLERLLASAAKKMHAFDRESFFELARIVSEEIEYSEENTERIKEMFYQRL